ncbi:MAG TPA: 50S ribosomal protein L34e [Candidatus Nanoarchaeia archaeon]|nr:50S ribosomal protein L34e [Candidatus Nanoarchaeia archaeon]
MVQPKFRSRSYRRVYRRLPTGKVALKFERRRTSKPQCKDCGKILSGVAYGKKSILKKLSKTQKRPERPYGGVLCSPCTRKVIVMKARTMVMKNG